MPNCRVVGIGRGDFPKFSLYGGIEKFIKKLVIQFIKCVCVCVKGG